MASPHLSSTSVSRETSWPVDGFGDSHLSGSEPRIFPGLVSRTQRRESVSERDRRVDSRRSTVTVVGGKDDAVAEEDGERSDGDLEEAGGMDDE